MILHTGLRNEIKVVLDDSENLNTNFHEFYFD